MNITEEHLEEIYRLATGIFRRSSLPNESAADCKENTENKADALAIRAECQKVAGENGKHFTGA